MPPPPRAEGALLPRSAPWMEKLVSSYCALKRSAKIIIEGVLLEKGQQNFSSMVFPRKVNKIALITGDALSTARRLGNNVRPLGVVRLGGMVRLSRLQTYVEVPMWGGGTRAENRNFTKRTSNKLE